MVLSNRKHNSYSEASTKTWRRSLLSIKEVQKSINSRASKAWAHEYQERFIQEQIYNKPIHKFVHKELNSAQSDDLIESIDYYLFGEC
jgi:hypothetical protein